MKSFVCLLTQTTKRVIKVAKSMSNTCTIDKYKTREWQAYAPTCPRTAYISTTFITSVQTTINFNFQNKTSEMSIGGQTKVSATSNGEACHTCHEKCAVGSVISDR